MGARFVLNVQDLFPRSAIDLGVLRNRLLIRLFEGMERRLYRSADHLTVHSQGNKDHVLDVGVPARQVTVLPNWIDTEFIRPDGNRHNPFAERYHLNGEFTLSFAGVLGYSQDVDVILGAAQRLRQGPAVRFLIVGDGVEKERVQRKAEALHLDNVTFLPMQSREVYPLVLHCSDVGLSTLNREVMSPVVPSKILSIMAAGKPVLACMNLEGDAPKIIRGAGCGYVFPAGDDEQLARAIRELQRSPQLCQTLGENGRRYCEAHFSLAACADRYLELFATLL
ncbi:MAG: glycosyltransferase family 4 protein, partial [Planctomycetes bacterium]|jgi:glycosyltransferase involved in cell wall biosynthesis|nr:glycosyltransferase family 4 protein [Planctomycetota bacterium]